MLYLGDLKDVKSLTFKRNHSIILFHDETKKSWSLEEILRT